MIPAEVPRPDLEAALLGRGGPVLLSGPPGAGKTTLLRSLARQLEAQGSTPVYLDLMAAASSPERFVTSALEALPAERFGARLSEATAIRRLAAAGRERGAEAVAALFGLWSSLDAASDRPAALLLDEATEIRSLAYFKGLRLVHEPFAKALLARQGVTVLASSFPTLAGRLWAFEHVALPPFSAAQAAALLPGPEGVAEDARRASCGWPRYLRALAESWRPGDHVAEVWTREMQLGGRLESACRHTYETLLLRSRGYGISKAVLGAVAHEEGLNLTALVRRLGRTPGAVRDYLHWLVGVDALRMRGKRYVYVDGLLRWWVRLYGRGTLPETAEIARAARAVLEPPADVPLPARAEAEAEAQTAAAPKHDALMEID
jgi:AAA ATPase domain